MVIGASDDKDIAGIITQLVPLFNKVFVTRSHHPRPMAPAAIVAELAKHNIEAQVADNVTSALSEALALAGERDLICVTGSLFVIAEAIELINRGNLKSRF